MKYSYHGDSLESVKRVDVVDIMEFVFEKDQEGTMLRYSYFPDVGHIELDRDVSTRLTFKVNTAIGEIYLSGYEYSDTLKLKVLSDDRIRVGSTNWDRYYEK